MKSCVLVEVQVTAVKLNCVHFYDMAIDIT